MLKFMMDIDLNLKHIENAEFLLDFKSLKSPLDWEVILQFSTFEHIKMKLNLLLFCAKYV